MRLNNYSYLHQKIRLLAQQLQQLSGMQLITDFNLEFSDVRFICELGYIIVDWQKNSCFALGHKITNKELSKIEEMIIDLNWLDTKEKIEKMFQKH